MEKIESLPEIMQQPKLPPALPPKPQFRNTLILKKIPSPSFLIDETSRKKQKPPIVTSTSRSLKFDNNPTKINNCLVIDSSKNDQTSFWKNRFNDVRSSFQTRQQSVNNITKTTSDSECPNLPKVTSIVKQFEEFKIDKDTDVTLNNNNNKKSTINEIDLQDENEDIKENFEEFNLDDCDLSKDPDTIEIKNSETFIARLANVHPIIDNVAETTVTTINEDNNNLTNTSSSTATTTDITNNLQSNGNYDNFLEATGLSNKSILTPSRLLSNHKSMLKPKDIKYKSKIKANAVMERHGGLMSNFGSMTSGITTTATTSPTTTITTTLTKHWTGPFV